MSTTILILEANPRDAPKNRFANEQNVIESRLRLLNSSFVVQSKRAVKKSDLGTILHTNPADIVHFSGHSTDESQLVLEDDEGFSDPVRSAEVLRGIFAAYRTRIRCIVLNSCYSAEQAEVISTSIDCVIGTPGIVSDDAATAFAGGFYQALAAGKSVQEAIDWGSLEVGLLDKSEKTPKLHERKSGVAKKLRFIPARPTIVARFPGDVPRKNDDDEYELWVSVANLSNGVKQVVYEYVDNEDDSIAFKDKFDIVDSAKKGFMSYPTFYGDVLIRAMIWSADEQGVCLASYLTQALRNYYGKTRNRRIVRALKDIEDG